MKPVKFEEANLALAKDQAEYLTLPAHRSKAGIVTSCWKLTWRERFKVFFKGCFWFQQHTFNSPLQPQLPLVDKPELKHGD